MDDAAFFESWDHAKNINGLASDIRKVKLRRNPFYALTAKLK